MYLVSPNYEAPEAVVKPKSKDVTAAIKSFVGDGRKSYEEVVKEIQKTENLTNDEIIAQCKTVHAEWYPAPEPEVVEEPIIEE